MCVDVCHATEECDWKSPENLVKGHMKITFSSTTEESTSGEGRMSDKFTTYHKFLKITFRMTTHMLDLPETVHYYEEIDAH